MLVTYNNILFKYQVLDDHSFITPYELTEDYKPILIRISMQNITNLLHITDQYFHSSINVRR
jgi:hypothetical protein